MRCSGSWFVVVLVSVCAVSAGLMWQHYRKENPTSDYGILYFEDGLWVVRAFFKPSQAQAVPVGANVVVTSSKLRGAKMAGYVQQVEPDGSVTVKIKFGPVKEWESKGSMPCAVTIDAATGGRR